MNTCVAWMILSLQSWGRLYTYMHSSRGISNLSCQHAAWLVTGSARICLTSLIRKQQPHRCLDKVQFCEHSSRNARTQQ